MLTDQKFDDIVAGFYAAASGMKSWNEALVPFQRSMSAIAVQLHAVDLDQGSVAYSYEASDMPAEAALDYIRTYNRIDPRAQLAIALQQGEWLNCWEHFDDNFVAKDRFYQEFLIPYGGRYVSGSKILQYDSVNVILGVHRGLGSPKLGATELAICRRMGRHLADALVLHRVNVVRQNHSLLGTELLSRLRAPLVLLDDQRRLQHTNPAAQALLAKSSAVAERGGRLYCRRSQDDSALVTALRQLLGEDKPGSAGTPVDKAFLRTHADSDAAALGLYLYALRPKETLYAFGKQPLAMLLLHQPGQRVELDPFVVAAAFDMTPGESRVAVAMARGMSLEQIAQRHAVSINTVRTQLQAILDKTGTTRQAELVSLLAALPMAALGLGTA